MRPERENRFPDSLLTAREAAALCVVSPCTVARWRRRGLLLRRAIRDGREVAGYLAADLEPFVPVRREAARVPGAPQVQAEPNPAIERRRAAVRARAGRLLALKVVCVDCPESDDPERKLFVRLNRLKRQALKIRECIDPARPRVADLDEAERLLADARIVRDELIERYSDLAVKVARRHARRQRGRDIDELESDARLELIGAVERYDPSLGVPFRAYAGKCLELRAIQVRHPDRPLLTGHDLAVEQAPAALEPDRLERVHAVVHRLLDGLDERERAVLAGRFGLDGQGPRSVQELAAELDLTTERVRRLEAEATARLRRLARDQAIEVPDE